MPEQQNAPQKVGFIGLGNMGAPMARHVAKAGFSVVVYDVEPSVRERLAEEIGGTAAVTPADFAGVTSLVTMLPNSKIVASALLDWDGGIPAYLAQGSVIIDMSSSDPTETAALGERLAATGLALVDAPVSGGVAKAEAGTLTIMIGGTDESVERAMPVLEAMSSAIVRTGPLGSAHAMKALNNVVAGATTMACFEALAAGRRFGLDPKTMTDIWNQSTAQSFVTSVVMENNVVTGTFDSGFALPLYAKDVAVAEAIFASTGVEATVSNAVAQAFRNAVSELGNVDHTRVAELIQGRTAIAS